MPTIPSLSGSYIDETYPRLVQVSGSSFADGLGNAITLGPPGAVNPTSTYYPFNNAGVFADSYLNQTGSILKSTYNGTDKGLRLDFTNNVYSLGNLIGDGDGLIFQNGVYSFGTGSLLTDGFGLGIDWNSKFVKLGDYSGINQNTQLIIDDANQIIKTYTGTDKGLKLDFSANSYTLGDPAGNTITVSDNGGGDTATLSLLNGFVTFTADDEININALGAVVLNSATTAIKQLTSSPQLNVLTIDTASGQLYYTASSAFGGGGGTSPGGSTGQIQYNNAGGFGGVDKLTFDGTNLRATGSFTGSFTGSLFGTATTASYVLQAVSASFATLAQTANTASYVVTAQTASYVLQAVSASFASNGGVTQLLAGPNITLSPTNGLGQVTITSTGGGGGSFNTATGSYGSFYSTQTQTNVAGTARSMSLNVTDITNGVSISGSTNPFNTYIKTQNAGVYDIQFSAQVDKTDSGTDEIWIWLRKNGTDINDSATSIQLVGNGAHYVAAWNFFVNAAANDYYQLMWYSPDANVRLHAEPAFGVVPGIPSLIVTANRVDQFLSNTGSFSGSFTGNLIGTATTASYILQAESASYASLAQTSNTASYIVTAQTASYVQTAQTASYVLQAESASFATTASYALTSAGGSGGISQGKVVAIVTGYSNLF